jgi:hypothetical protein
MANEKDKNEGDWLKTTLKAIGLVLVILLALVVVGFGLLVGICTFGARC